MFRKQSISWLLSIPLTLSVRLQLILQLLPIIIFYNIQQNLMPHSFGIISPKNTFNGQYFLQFINILFQSPLRPQIFPIFIIFSI